MRVLVGYASAHGSTQGIATEIADRLGRAGLQTDVQPVDDIGSLGLYDAVVLGSAIHDMAWLPPAAAFVRSRAAELSVRPVWLFSVSSVGASSSFFGPRVARFMRRMRSEPKDIPNFRTAVQARGHRVFSGAVERSHWDLGGHLFLRAFGGSYGDHRDWPDIDAWADGIAESLLTAPNAVGKA